MIYYWCHKLLLSVVFCTYNYSTMEYGLRTSTNHDGDDDNYDDDDHNNDALWRPWTFFQELNIKIYLILKCLKVV